MQRDKKLGLALGVLLVGIVAAMFFRLDAGKHDFFPKLNSSKELDERIAERRFATYPGDNDDDADEEDAKPKDKLVEPPLWEMPAFLADDNDPAKGQGQPPEDWLAKTPATPDPIIADAHEELHDVDMFDSGSFHGTPVPHHNQAWTVSDTKVKTPPAAGNQRQGAQSHRVRPGDTLSGLAAYYLGSSGRFNEIYILNRDVLANPNSLTVGMDLKIPGAAQPRTPQAKSGDSVFRNADGQHAAEPSEKKSGPVLQASPTSLKSSSKNGNAPQVPPSPSRRFVPAGKAPFSPRRTTQNTQGNTKNTLTQTPPADLPDID